MTSTLSTQVKTHIGFLLCLVFSAAILFVRLGSFGFFEPFETSRVDQVEKIIGDQKLPAFPAAVSERAAAVFTDILGDSEFAMRLPSALFALLAAVLTYWVLFPFLGPVASALAALFLTGSPVWMFHGRQLTGAAPSIAAEIATLGGLMTAVFTETRRARVAGIVVALLGALLGVATRGLSVGLAAPAFAAAFAGASSGVFSKEKDAGKMNGQKLTVLVLVALGVLAAGTVFAVLISGENVPLVTGKEASAPLSKHTFEYAFEQMVYGWFPLCVFAPLAVAEAFRGNDAEPKTRRFARTFAIYAILLEYAAQVISLDVNGMRFAVTALPMVILIALAVDDLLCSEKPRRLDVFIAAALLAILIRDFAQNNQTLLYAYGVDAIPIPKDDFKPVILAGLFSIPTALLIVFSYLSFRVRRIRPLSLTLGVLAPVSFAVFISFFLMPLLSVHLSSKAGIEMVEKYRTGGEPLAVYGLTKSGRRVRKISTAREAAEWLGKPERAFLLFPPKELPAIDQRLRKKFDQQAFVLEKGGERFMVAVSRAEEGEKNVSPLKGNVQSKSFDPPPLHETDVSFDDKVTLLGWRLESEGDTNRLSRGQDLIFTSYWYVTGKIPGDYKMFMHFDGPGGRMHGDHDVFNGNFPTSIWQKGDYIREVYRKKVPLYQAKGTYTVKMGLFNNKGRLPVKDLPAEEENALTVTETVIE